MQENREQASSSHQRRDPPLPPSSKRHKVNAPYLTIKEHREAPIKAFKVKLKRKKKEEKEVDGRKRGGRERARKG